jgi:hypothetical protein
MSTSAKPLPGSFLYGAPTIARFVNLSIEETLRRIETGEIPVLARERGFVIAEKARLAEIRTSPHFRRQRQAA